MIAFALHPPAPTIDILIHPAIEFEAAYVRRVDKSLGDMSLSLASIDDLIALKTGTGRLHDTADIAALKRFSEIG